MTIITTKRTTVELEKKRAILIFSSFKGNNGITIKKINNTISKSNILSVITVPNACGTVILCSFASTKALRNSPSLKNKIPLPKYPIIVALKTWLKDMDSNGSTSNFHLKARGKQLKISKAIAIQTL